MMSALARPRRAGDLAELLRAAPTPAFAPDRPLAGLADDSRRVRAGEAFFARRGSTTDGAAFAWDAVARGAVLVVAESELPPELPALRVADAAAALRAAADAWYGRPQDDLELVGITGTKGKTTTAWLAAAGLRACERRVATLGTIAYDLGDGEPEPAANTTPGPLELRRLLARAREAGCDVAVLEVSSHALHQARTRGLSLRAGVFTNLASDHMDYHGSPKAYFEAKARLFRELEPGATAVLNREDAAWSELAALCRGAVLTYGTSVEADLRAAAVQLAADRSSFRLVVAGDGERDVTTPLVGAHNVLNLLAALGACAGLGHDPIVAADGAAAVGLVPGRLQRVEPSADLHAFVDYAHTESALRQVLGFLRSVGAAPITCVVGCGGDRDRSKRPLMARAAAELADSFVLTSDNPRTEDPRAILQEMAAGLDDEQRTRAVLCVDRREAIRRAVEEAPGGATLLVAGKGHETYQIQGTDRIPFDDVDEVRRALVERASRAREGDPPRGASPA